MIRLQVNRVAGYSALRSKVYRDRTANLLELSFVYNSVVKLDSGNSFGFGQNFWCLVVTEEPQRRYIVNLLDSWQPIRGQIKVTWMIFRNFLHRL